MVVDFGFQGCDVDRRGRELLPQILYFLRGFGINAQRPALFDCLGQLLFHRRLVGRLIEGKGPLYLWQQVVVEERRHLATLGVHDSVEPEIEVGLVKLKELLEEFLQLVVTVTHGVSYAGTASGPSS